MKKQFLKNQKVNYRRTTGITIIALAITIIVLLILAGISMQMLSGNNGILNRAVQAKEATRGAEVKDIVALEVANNIGVDHNESTEQIRANLISRLQADEKLTSKEIEDLEKNDVITIGGITVDFSALGSTPKLNTLVAMFQKAISDGCTNEDGKCDKEEHLHIGDYVSYTNPTSGEYTVNAGEVGGEDAQTYFVSQNQLNWRVLGIEGTGNSAYIKLIAGSPMKKSKANESEIDENNPYLYMKGAKACINSVSELNKICALYKNEDLATEAVSVTMDDIDKITGVTTTELKQQYNADQIGGGKKYGESYSFSNQYTPESWLTSTQTTVSGTVNG